MSKLAVAKAVGVKMMEQRKTRDAIVTVAKCAWPGVKLMLVAEVKNQPKKVMHTDNVKMLRKLGMPLNAIATILGVSPSYAYKMLRA